MANKKGILDTVMGMGEEFLGSDSNESQESSGGRGMARASKEVRERVARKGGKASHGGGRKS